MIKVIFTGGTISSTPTEKGINVSSDRVVHKLLIENYYKATSDIDTEFEICQPLSVLSENMTVSDWNVLLETLRDTDFSKLDGIIIAHGTDTLAYTSNMLSLILSGISIPVVLVSSNYVLTDKRANGNNNFVDAVSFIKTSDLRGVYAIYRDDNGKSVVYLGSRLKQCKTLTNAYSSTFDVNFGEMKDGMFFYNQNKDNPSEREINAVKNKMLLHSDIKLKSCVAQIYPYTGLDYSSFCFSDKISAVVNYLYHGSTLCMSENDEYLSSFIQFTKLERNNNISFFVAPFEHKRTDLYASTKNIEVNNITPLYNISEEMAYVKLLVAFSCDNISLRNQILNSDIFFEQVRSI